MSHIVTGMPSAVGYVNGDNCDHGGRQHFTGYGWSQNCGISDKDQMFAQTIEANERTRDILGAIADSVVATEKTGAANGLAAEKIGAANQLATEKVGAANQLATEKVGAAAVITAEKVGAAGVLATQNASHEAMLAMQNLAHANTLAVQLGFKDAALQLAECCCDIKKEVADVKATVLSVDANRIRDDLQHCRTELLLQRNGPGNS